MKLEDIINQVIKDHEIYRKGKTILVVDGNEYRKKTFNEFMTNKKINTIGAKNLLLFSDTEKSNVLEKIFNKLLRNSAELTSKGSMKGELSGSVQEKAKKAGLVIPESEIWDRYTPVIDMKTGEVFVFDTGSNSISQIAPESWFAAQGFDSPKKSVAIPVVSGYDPYTLEPSYKVSHDMVGLGNPAHFQELSFVNRHVPPKWRFKAGKNTQCPEKILQFLEHLFYEESLKFVLNWARTMVLGRNGTILALNSVKGTGKYILYSLFSKLVGDHNSGKAERGFLTSRFNMVLKDKRLILLDEQPINTPEKMDTVKDYLNEVQNLEGKGVNALRTEEVYYSMIVCNNREIDLKLEQDDRRFSVPDMRDVPLRKEYGGIWEPKEIETFVQEVSNNEELIRDFGSFILGCDFTDIWDSETPYKGKKFERIVEVSLWEWQKFVIESISKAIRDGHREINFLDMKAEYKQIRTTTRSGISLDVLRAFLNNYRYRGHKLGELKRHDGEYDLVINEELFDSSLFVEEDDAEGTREEPVIVGFGDLEDDPGDML